jgi:NAD-specific glutamate dehydrogenase
VLRTILVRRNERQINIGLGSGREFDFSLFGGVLEPLQSKAILAQTDSVLLAEFICQIVDDPLVEILAAEEGIAVGRLDLEHAVADLENRDVECPAARRRLVDDAQYFKAGSPAGVFGRLTLGIVEIGRNGDHRLGHGIAEIRFRRFLHLSENEGADLARAVLFALNLDPCMLWRLAG